MLDPTTIAVAIGGLITAASAAYIGIQKARDDREQRLAETTAQQVANARADRSDIVTMITSDRDYWRNRYEKAETEIQRERARADSERERADALQRQLIEVYQGAEHAADVAQAALMAFQQKRGTADVTPG